MMKNIIIISKNFLLILMREFKQGDEFRQGLVFRTGTRYFPCSLDLMTIHYNQ